MTALLCSHPSQESCRPQEELGVIFWVGLFGFGLKDKLHGKAELSILLLFKHDSQKLGCIVTYAPPLPREQSQKYHKRGRGSQGSPGSAVAPPQAVNSQEIQAQNLQVLSDLEKQTGM